MPDEEKGWQIGYTASNSGLVWLDSLYTEEEANRQKDVANLMSRRPGLRGCIDLTTWHVRKKPNMDIECGSKSSDPKK
ncbi:MAG: hypothetical protein A3J55_00850 [Candidatus Ryanbacteria bacterium RIFCSPHIGHO2_02_FULL_45_17b]|uniref:Uncharacterized protein n=1 Tax=Candidatus Ryanbacteria bacterium RIFCSPHIGHO2_01_FULL_45_22 TaxID=1802114 RepID=A0A1G2G0V0_9BACT|nr:MAG: hypothetical protein A2719_03315 [Candidatus Ryanbacteria bacterium RIFCSPHIGHO2_01_FULL_45_22]OGZ47090.1 MAG: hypothetical protein A3J55_00850 [Candidatus Ryanbacteria bacterium RIFCSPHIGHO2_02_FULL_45_17b]